MFDSCEVNLTLFILEDLGMRGRRVSNGILLSFKVSEVHLNERISLKMNKKSFHVLVGGRVKVLR